MSCIALTGATSLLGSALVPLLLHRGHRLRVLTRRTPTANADGNVTFVAGRLDDARALDALVRDADCAVHAAYETPEAAASVAGERGRTPGEQWLATNLLGTAALLERAATTRRRQFVYVSSLAVYGHDPNTDPLGDRFVRDETFPLWPHEYYGSMRAAAEKLVVTAAHSHALNASVFRLGCVLGLRSPWQQSPLFATVEEAVHTGEIRTAIGTYALGVADAARVLADALDDDAVRGEVFNVFDRWVDHAEVAPLIERRIGRAVRVAGAAASEPRTPIRNDKLRVRLAARGMAFTTTAALADLTAQLVDRCQGRSQP